MLNPGLKILLILSIFLSLFLINTSYTDADIFAERVVTKNIFSAKTLNFLAMNTVNNSVITNLFRSMGMQPNGYDISAIKIKRDGPNGFKYRLKTKKTNGDDEFCNTINLTVFNKNWQQKYSGKLTNVMLTSSITSADPDDWIFFVSFDTDDVSMQNKLCEFSFDFSTFTQNPDETGGIRAQRLLTNVITSSNW